MNSLLKNLRDLACFAHGDVSIADDAADRIEELEKALRELSDVVVEAFPALGKTAQIKNARAALGEKKDERN